MFDDLIKTIKAQLYDRIASPLFSSYLISWVGWNYKFLLTLFSGMKVQEKLDFISKAVYPSFNYLLCHGVLYPLITSLLIIFIYPYPAKFTYEFYRRRQVELKEVQQRIDDETPLTKEEAKKIRTDALKMSIAFEEEIEKLREENIALRKIIKTAGTKEETDVDTTDGTTEFGNDEAQFSDVNQGKVEVSNINRQSEKDNSSKSIKFYPGNGNKNDVRLLVTGPEYLKAEIENTIRTEEIFSGYRFMVELNEKIIKINVLPRVGLSKEFKYDFHIPSDGKIGYESFRIRETFKDDFTRFLEENKKHSIEN